jgi:hypothetical protein
MEQPNDLLEILAALTLCIDNNDTETFMQLFPYVPWQDMETDELDKRMIEFLKYSLVEKNTPDFARFIISEWEKATWANINFKLYMVCKMYADPDTLSKIFALYLPVSFVDLVHPEVITQINDETTTYVCAALDRLCVGQGYPEYALLYDEALSRNLSCARYMKMRMESSSGYAALPSHVDFTVPPVEFSSLPPSLCGNSDVNLCAIKEKLSEFISLPDNLETEFSKMSEKDRKEISEWATKTTSDVIFRSFGPAHPIENDNNPDCIDHRMLKCNCFERYDEETDTVQDVDWFSGVCFECSKKIRSRSHALRLPMPGGGWWGCFCSFHCIKIHLEDRPGCNDKRTLLQYTLLREVQRYFKTLKNEDKLIDTYDTPEDDTSRNCNVAEEPILGNLVCVKPSYSTNPQVGQDEDLQ